MSNLLIDPPEDREAALAMTIEAFLGRLQPGEDYGMLVIPGETPKFVLSVRRDASRPVLATLFRLAGAAPDEAEGAALHIIGSATK